MFTTPEQHKCEAVIHTYTSPNTCLDIPYLFFQIILTRKKFIQLSQVQSLIKLPDGGETSIMQTERKCITFFETFPDVSDNNMFIFYLNCHNS